MRIFKAALLLTTLCLTTMPVQAKDWLTDLQNERNDREETNIRLPLKQVWVVHDIGWSPVYMGGKLYTVDATRGWLWGSGKLYVNEIDQTNGKIKTRYLAGKVKDYKYVRMMGHEGKLYISTVWCFDPSVDKSKIYLNVFAYNPATGRAEWQWASRPVSARNVGDIEKIGAWITATENKIIIASMQVWQDSKVFCLDATTGQDLWNSTEPQGNINNTYLPVAEGKVFVHTDNRGKNKAGKDEGGHLAALDLSTGKVLWDKEFKEVDQEKLKQYKVTDYKVCQAETESSIIWKNKILYVPLCFENANFRYKAIEASTGKLLWEQRVYPSMPYYSGVVDEKYSYVAAFDENITKINNLDGKIVWQKSLKKHEAAVRLQSPDWLCYSQMAPLTKTLEFVSKADGNLLASYKIENITYKRMLDYVESVIAMDNRILVENEDETYYLFEGAK
jgi:outer membrane protein assembly factor BamB